MANVAVAGTLFCSDGSEIPLYVASVAEGTETNLTTSTQSNFTVSASAVGTAFAGKTIMANTAADRECALSVYTNRGRYHIFAVTPSSGATNQLVSILTGNGIGETLQGENLIKCLCTSVDGIKLAPSGMGVYVVDDKNSIVGAMVATNPASAQSMFDMVNIPINLNFQAQAITSS
jgi:hypothetical protein